MGGAKGTARDLADDAQGELARLRGGVERLMGECVTPALSSTVGAAKDHAQRAKDAIVEQSERLSDAVEGRPLLAVGLGLAAGYRVGRPMGGDTHVCPRR